MNKEESPIFSAQRELDEETAISGTEEDFRLIGEMNYDDGIVYVVEYMPRLEWKDIDVREGAGAGFFSKKEILNLHATEQAKLIVERFL